MVVGEYGSRAFGEEASVAKGEIPAGERAVTRYYHTTTTLLLSY